MRRLLNDSQFDDLPELTQMHYLFCPVCKCYYLASDKGKHLCKMEVRK